MMVAPQEEVELGAEEQALVEQGRELVERMDSAQLRIGRLALEFAPMGERGYRTGAGARSAVFAERIGLMASTLKVYRNTAHAWSVTDVSDDEFSFALLQALVSVGDKEGLIERLRSTPPPSGKPRWGAQEAVEFAQEHHFLQGTRKRIAGGFLHTPRDVNLQRLGETLRKMSFEKVDVADRERLDPLLAKVEAEAARLRAELNRLSGPPGLDD